MRQTFFIETLWLNPRYFFSVAIIVILSVCCHEFMHAYAALRFGDATAAERGHLTLNPFKQMGMWSLLLFTFFGLAWGAVPVNPARMRGRYAPAAVAASGPLTNLVLAFLFVLFAFVCLRWKLGDMFAVQMLFHGGVINVVLFVLNMIPIPGFDGFAVLSCFFPTFLRNSSEAVRGAFFVMIVLLFVSIQYLYDFGAWLAGKELYFLQWIFRV